jgi:hypothetical protein
MGKVGRMVREGVYVGLIGYAAVAVFYAFFDLLAGRGAVFTLNLLGKFFFRGVRDPAVLTLPIAPDVGAMVAYNFVHLVAALGVGLFVAWLVSRVEERPSAGVPVLLVMAVGYVLTVLTVDRLSHTVGALLPLWSIVVVNTLAALGGGVFLWRAHPGLWGRVTGGGHA